MKTEKGRGMRLKKILHISTSSSSNNSTTLSPNHQTSSENNNCNNNVKINIPNEYKHRQSIASSEDFISKVHSINNTLPLLQIWPSQDSPSCHNDENKDANNFKYPVVVESHSEKTLFNNRGQHSRRSSRSSLYGGGDQLQDHLRINDSGIDSLQTSPNPNIEISPIQSPRASSPIPPQSPLVGKTERKKSCSLLHPDHARILAYRQSISSDQGSMDDDFSEHLQHSSPNGVSYSSSSSQTSIVAAANTALGRRRFSQNLAASPSHSPYYHHQDQRLSDPWLQLEYDRSGIRSQRRRSSTVTMSGRLSLFDALDLEYALLRAAARGSIGPYSLRLGDSVNKLTFTQSLAFPELASKRRHSNPSINFSQQHGETETCLNIFAKVMTSCVLVMISFLVFLIVYKYVKT